MSEPKQHSFADLAAPGPRRGELPIPAGGKLDHCKSCKAAIVWTHTEAGRATPLSLATAQTRDGTTYLLPHWTDCPDAKQWSRKGRKRV